MWTLRLNTVAATVPPINAAAMLSRKLDSTNTMTSSTNPPRQSSGRYSGNCRGTWLSSKCRDSSAKPISRPNRLSSTTHSSSRWPVRPASPGAVMEARERQLVEDDGEQTGRGHLQRPVMQHRDAQQGQGEQRELEGNTERLPAGGCGRLHHRVSTGTSMRSSSRRPSVAVRRRSTKPKRSTSVQ